MEHRRSPTEKDEEHAAAPDLADDEAASPLERFKSLAKKLIRVPRPELEEQRMSHKRTKGKHR
jgi:hypothetical protein